MARRTAGKQSGLRDSEFRSRLFSAYEGKTQASRRLFAKARRIFPGGQSHNSRFFAPYPFFSERAQGKYLWDVDGNRYVDYWMGHTALILGHSPPVVTRELRKQVGKGLLFGTPNVYAYELGELVSKSVPCAEAIRFCTTGAEATMYAVRLARAATKRKLIVKIAGGWHGYNSTLSVGVEPPYDAPESAGLTADDAWNTRLISFNDLESARKVLVENSSDVAGVIVEPVAGAGGVLPAKPEFLSLLREECDRIGALLIFDEIITGFRLALGGAQEYYGTVPDLCTLGKILGGGLPASAIAGRREIMALVDTTTYKTKSQRCWIGGGTFSENALAMRAGIATIKYLRGNRRRVYQALGRWGDLVRMGVDAAFSEQGIRTRTTGAGSLFATHFLSDNQDDLVCPEDVSASRLEAEDDYYLSLIGQHGIFFIPRHVGAISTSHTSADRDRFIESTRAIADEMARAWGTKAR